MNLASTPSNPVIDLPGVVIHHGDALRLLAQIPSSSVDAVVCDPPYAIRADASLRTLVHGTDSKENGGHPADASGLDRPEVAHRRNLEPDTFAAASMLGQQSTNWHEKATHSRGYADNDNTVFAAWVTLWAAECLRVLKPGGHIVAFGGTRTWHRLATAIEEAGFEIRDSLAWIYATGCPKSLNVGRAVAQHRHAHTKSVSSGHHPTDRDPEETWDGWYTGRSLPTNRSCSPGNPSLARSPRTY